MSLVDACAVTQSAAHTLPGVAGGFEEAALLGKTKYID